MLQAQQQQGGALSKTSEESPLAFSQLPEVESVLTEQLTLPRRQSSSGAEDGPTPSLVSP